MSLPILIGELPVATASQISAGASIAIDPGGIIRRARLDDLIGQPSSFLQSGTGAVARTVQDKERDTVNAKDFGVVADGVTNDSAALALATTYANSIGATLRLPPGIILIGTTTWVLKNKVTYIGAGKDSAQTVGTVIKYTGSSDAIQVNNPINSSTAANITIQDLWVQCMTRTAGKAAIADVGSTFLTLNRVGVNGNDYGIILDQSELVLIDDCDIELSHASSTAGIWLVNGADHSVGASAFFTNRITVRNCQFNGSVGVAIADDGGLAHSYIDNNFNTCAKHIRVTAQTGLQISGNECENPTSTSIDFAATQLDGTASSASIGVNIWGNVFSSSAAINFVTYAASSLTEQVMFGNSFTNNNAGGSPTTGISNVTTHFGFGNTQGGTGSSTNTNLGNFLGGVAGAGVSLRVGSKTLNATEAFLWNQESPFTRFYIGDGSGFSVAFSKRTGSVTTDLVVFNDTGTLASFAGNVTYTGSISPAGGIFPGTDAGAAQAVCKISAGNGAPNNANGANGDFYFRGDGGAGTFIYHKAAGAWTAFA